jgi:hypothetical protein
MNEHDQDRMKNLLRQALPPVDGDAEPERDLWPAMLRHLDSTTAARPWFDAPLLDWALLAGLVGVVVFFPASIPVLLYCL